MSDLIVGSKTEEIRVCSVPTLLKDEFPLSRCNQACRGFTRYILGESRKPSSALKPTSSEMMPRQGELR